MSAPDTVSPSSRPTAAPVVPSTPSRLAWELGTISALWHRDLLRLVRERSRWIGVVLQPLLFWIVIGSGMDRVFTLPGAEGTSYRAWFFPGILVMIVLFTTIFATMSVIEDRQSGFLQQVLVSPGSRLSLVLGKVAGVTTMALIQAALFLPVAPLAGFPFGGISWLSLLAVVVLACVSLTAVNLAMAWVLGSTQGYHAIMSVVLIPLWILSGAMFPPSDGWIGAVMAANPLAYAVDGVRAALGGAGHIPLDLAVLAGASVLALALAVRTCSRPGGGRR